MTTNQQQALNREGKHSLRFKMGGLTVKYGVVLAFMGILILSVILYPGFLRPVNLLNLISQMSIVGIMAIGVTYVMITGGFDLSVGGIYAATATFVASIADKMPLSVAILLALVIGIAAGLLNGVLVAKLRVPAFIATLGSGSIFIGFALLYSNSQPFFVKKQGFRWLGSGYIGSVPVSVIVLILAFVVFGILLAYTVYGRSLYAIGGNNEASRLSGLRVSWLRIGAYMISGFCAALAGILIASRLGQGQANIGDTISLDVIAAVVIGGTSLSGGEGAIWRTVIGVSTLAIVSNVFDSLSLSPYWQSIFKGMIIIAAVMFDYYSRSKNQ